MTVILLNQYRQLRNQVIRLSGQKYFKPSIGMLVSIIILFFMGYAVYANWQELNKYEWQISYPHLALAFVGYPVSLVFWIINWHIIMNHIEGTISLKENARIYCYSNLSKRLPSSIWYIMGRAYMYQKQGVNYALTITATALETFYLFLSGLLVCLILLPFSSLTSAVSSPQIDWIWILLIIILSFFLSNSSLLNKILGAIQKRSNNTKQIQFSRKDMLIMMVNYAATWIWGGILLFILINGISSVQINHLLDITLVGTATGVASVGLAFVLLYGIGVRELSLAILLSNYLTLPIAIVVSLVLRIYLAISEVFWSLLVLGLFAIVETLRKEP